MKRFGANISFPHRAAGNTGNLDPEPNNRACVCVCYSYTLLLLDYIM